MTIVAIHQPQYLPWIAYFDKADQADIFIYLDNVQYARRGVQNRNAIKSATGPLWLTVPAIAKRETLIQDVLLADQSWCKSHLRSLELNYHRAPNFELLNELSAILSSSYERLVDLNIAVTEWHFEKLGIQCRRIRASELSAVGAKEDLIISLTKAVGGTTYLSGGGAATYQQPLNFTQAGLELRYQNYRQQPYRQCFPEVGFSPDLATLDLLLNVGASAARESLLTGRLPSTENAPALQYPVGHRNGED